MLLEPSPYDTVAAVSADACRGCRVVSDFDFDDLRRRLKLEESNDPRKAAKEIKMAWEAGFKDIDLLLEDPDLENLRAWPKGNDLVEKLVAEERERMRLRGFPLLFEAPTLGALRVVPPRTLQPGRKYPLVMVLHGHGANPENYAGLFDKADAAIEAVVCAPYGPYPIPQQRGHGFSWFPAPWLFQDVLKTGPTLSNRDDGRAELEEIELALTKRHVLTAVDEVVKVYPVDEERIFLLGHSEGGVLAYSLGLGRPDRIRGVVVVGSRLKNADAPAERLAAAAQEIDVLICHSPDDEQIEFDHAENAQRILDEVGVSTRLVTYRGGHGLTSGLIQTIARWIRAKAGW